MLFTTDGRLVSEIKKQWELAVAEVAVPTDLFTPENWSEWKEYGSMLPAEKQIAKMIEAIDITFASWDKGNVNDLSQQEKLEIYSAFTAAEFLMHSLNLRFGYDAPELEWYGTNKKAYDKIIGGGEDHVLYVLAKTMEGMGVNEDKLSAFKEARTKYQMMVKDGAFSSLVSDMSARSIQAMNRAAAQARQAAAASA